MKMKERGLAPCGCWKLHASVSTRQERPRSKTATAGRSRAWTCTYRSVLVRMIEDARRPGTAQITDSLREIARAGKRPRVVLEATYGSLLAAGVLQHVAAEVHLAHR